MADLFAVKGDTQDAANMARPLPERLRPKALEEVVGQDHIVGPEGTLTKMLSADRLSSIIFWGPPGCGKTTMARILASHTDLHFEQLSAIFSGVKDLRQVFDAAKIRRQNGQGTLLFVDEIHRFNKSQQDAFLPVVEDGTIILVGATTENPSFELNAALLSRTQVLVLKRLDDDGLETLLQRAEEDAGHELPLTDKARLTLKAMADGDGRYLLSMVEQVMNLPEEICTEDLVKLLQKRAPLYDKGDDAHYNALSAFHKSLRGSDVDASLYWMARMLQGGEDPDTIFRRMTCVASEDITNADPQALQVVMAAWQAYDRLGLPEGELPMAQACVYLATAPKSNSSYMAFAAAKAAARDTGSLMPPKNILNAPTAMMKDLGYHEGYQYDHDHEGGFSGQNFWPEELGPQKFYDPPERGFEREIKKRLDYWAKIRKSKA